MEVLGTSEMFVFVTCMPSVVSWHLREVPKLTSVSVGQHPARSGPWPVCVGVTSAAAHTGCPIPPCFRLGF